MRALNDPFAIVTSSDDLSRLVVETLELAGVEAERLVAVHVAPGRRRERGRCRVALSFVDSDLLAVFRSVDAIRPARHLGWTLDRRWAEAGGDASLDEEMCLSVVRRLHRTFGWRLRARALSTYR